MRHLVQPRKPPVPARGDPAPRPGAARGVPGNPSPGDSRPRQGQVAAASPPRHRLGTRLPAARPALAPRTGTAAGTTRQHGDGQLRAGAAPSPSAPCRSPSRLWGAVWVLGARLVALSPPLWLWGAGGCSCVPGGLRALLGQWQPSFCHPTGSAPMPAPLSPQRLCHWDPAPCFCEPWVCRSRMDTALGVHGVCSALRLPPAPPGHGTPATGDSDPGDRVTAQPCQPHGVHPHCWHPSQPCPMPTDPTASLLHPVSPLGPTGSHLAPIQPRGTVPPSPTVP